jgi:hypothetical protein
MRHFKIIIIVIITLFSCSKKINVFKTGTVQSKGYVDTLQIDNTNRYIVVKVKINGQSHKLIFDTGADLILLPKDSSASSKIKVRLTDANKRISDIDTKHIEDLVISKTHFSDLYSLSIDLPAPFLCYGDGLIGNNVFKSSNILIESGQMIISDHPFDLVNNKMTLDIFYFGANRLFSNIILNNCQLDTCLFDYGGNYDIQLPYYYYENFKSCFKPNKIINKISTPYSAHGISVPDTALRLNCNVDFNGIHIDSVNIDFVKKSEKRLGYIFLKRFNKIVINNTTNKLLIDALGSNANSHEPIYLFDWTDGRFIVSRTIMENMEIKIGDRFDEINSTKSNSFLNYCDFLKWRDSLMKDEWLYIKTSENKTIKINNRR